METTEIVPIECSVFFSFLRMHCKLPLGVERPQAITLLRGGCEEAPERQILRTIRGGGVGPAEFEIEAIIDRAFFPQDYAVQVGFRGHSEIIACADIVERERAVYARTGLSDYHDLLGAWLEANPGRRPALLDIGGRARSGYRLAGDFGQCDVVTADIVADDSVDVVTDIHQMSQDLGVERFDFAICVSVFEHLLMPWKAVLEINKVLKPGGIILVQTHQTVGLHDFPWDYYRFSDESWKGLFNRQTGFHILSTLMTGFQRIVPLHYYAVYAGFESAGGFNESSVIARKTGGTSLNWPVALQDVIDSRYPA